MYGGWIDSGFPYMNIADSIIVAKEGRLMFYPFVDGPGNSLNNVANVRSVRLVVVLLPVLLAQITGIPVSMWTFFPFAGILLPLVGYLLVKRLLSSTLLGFFFGSYLALEPQGLLRNYNMNIQGYGLLFFLLALFLVSKYLSTKSKTRRWFLMFCVFFSMAMLSYYSAEFYIFTFVFFMMIFFIRHREDVAGRSFFRNATLVCILTILAFEPIATVYSRSLVSGGGKNILEVVTHFLSDVFSVLGIRQIEQPTALSVKTPLPLLLLNLSLIGVIILPILLFPLFIRRKERIFDCFFAILLTGVMDFVAYSGLEGHVDLKFMYLFFPICSLIAIDAVLTAKTMKHHMRIGQIFAIALVCIAATRFGFYAVGPYSQSSELHVKYVHQFDTIVEYSVSPCIFLTDNVAGGKILTSFADQGVFKFDSAYQFGSTQSIQFLYSGDAADLNSFRETSGETPVYILVSYYALNNIFPAQGWQSFPPLQNFSKAIELPSVEVVYQGLDSAVLIVR
jgi:hypothetical protein